MLNYSFFHRIVHVDRLNKLLMDTRCETKLRTFKSKLEIVIFIVLFKYHFGGMFPYGVMDSLTDLPYNDMQGCLSYHHLSLFFIYCTVAIKLNKNKIKNNNNNNDCCC